MNGLRHIAIIMDGNGRWAKAKGKPRSCGHEVGAKNVTQITKQCALMGVDFLSLYAFSTENWKRPKKEVDFLMKLLDKFLKNELKTLLENDIRFRVIGDVSKFSPKLQKRIEETVKLTSESKKMTQVLAVNYGSRDEITRAVNKIKKSHITMEDIQNSLDTAEFPDVDILIRTGGEKRLSNFLLWQSAYAELFFTDTLWPDFDRVELESIIERYRKIERRFGGI